MERDFTNKLEYTIAVIGEFASAHSISTAKAFEYLDKFKGLDFIDRFYDVEHTLSFEDVVEDLTAYCKRQGGQIA